MTIFFLLATAIPCPEMPELSQLLHRPLAQVLETLSLHDRPWHVGGAGHGDELDWAVVTDLDQNVWFFWVDGGGRRFPFALAPDYEEQMEKSRQIAAGLDVHHISIRNALAPDQPKGLACFLGREAGALIEAWRLQTADDGFLIDTWNEAAVWRLRQPNGIIVEISMDPEQASMRRKPRPTEAELRLSAITGLRIYTASREQPLDVILMSLGGDAM